MTVHKSQDLSLEYVIVDVRSKVFSSGMTYVTLSRVESLDSLHLMNFDPSKVKASSDTIDKYNRLQSVHRPDLPQILTSDETLKK